MYKNDDNVKKEELKNNFLGGDLFNFFSKIPDLRERKIFVFDKLYLKTDQGGTYVKRLLRQNIKKYRKYPLL